jgi:hypothetical protein
MRETFRGFLLMRFVGLIALVIVVALVVGIRALARGSDVLGIGILAVAVVLGVGTGFRVVAAAAATGSRPRSGAPPSL